MAEKKITKREWYAILKELVETSNAEQKAELLEFIAHEVELLSKKHSKETKAQKENKEVNEKILFVLAGAEKPMTVSEMMKEDELAEYSNQKLSALLRGLVEQGKVVRTEDKKKAYFSLP